MDISDLFITPFYLLLIYLLAYWVRPKASNKITRRYFIPALTVKIIGGLAFGLIYQFYYGGGDTFEYYKQALIIIDALINQPSAGIQLLIEKGGSYNPATFEYASRMYWYKSPTEFFVIRTAALIGFFTLKSYASITIIFAALSFTGIWAMFLTFLKLYPHLHKQFAIAIFFFPSVFFWGSGLMKDTICIGALGWLFWGFYIGFIEKKQILSSLIIIIIAGFVIKNIKSYILLSFLPPAMFWIFNENSNRIKNKLLKLILKPIILGTGLIAAFWGLQVTTFNTRINIKTVPEITKINADYLYNLSLSEGGSAYKLGELDGTYSSMFKIAPQAIVVALFRPFLWEVKNPVMLLASIEAAFFIYFTLNVLFKTGVLKTLIHITGTPILVFCIIFSIIFAFGVGLNSNNFGTLVRYKIPLLPFYLCALFIIRNLGIKQMFKKKLKI